MKKPKVQHKIAYSSVLERTKTYTTMYEETYCGQTKKFVIDEPLTERDVQKRARQNLIDAAKAGQVCKSCEVAFERQHGKVQ